jgi:DNA mismatch repair ATPase MutS
LKDALNNPAIIQSIYDLTIEVIASEKKIYFGVITYPSSILRRSIEVLHLFVGLLKKLRTIAQTDRFESEGFLRLFAMLRDELSDDYFRTVQNHLDELKFRGGVLISAELGKGNKGTNYILRKQDKKHWWALGAKTLHVNDTSGAKILAELRDRGINAAANALAQSVDHILSFFSMLRTELAFYIGCIHLQATLPQTCFPLPIPPNEQCHAFQGLYDVSLALTTKQTVVGNAVSADQKDFVIITGANQGGKSTFLRSVGLAQVMMQCGMFVGAEYFCANVCNGLFTHFKREEDTTMSSGKLDEELSRLNEIINHLTAYSMVLFNESFAATNEREGSEIAGQIVRALAESHVKVFFVTHLYEFARDLYDQHLDNALFLRAERQTNGDRTFKMIEGEPLQTSYGKDLYRKLFEVTP